MHTSWFRAVFPIALIFSFRMLGLFMLIPVFSVMAGSLQDSTPFLIGLGLGAYGLTQGLLQIPAGMMSDHFGRKPIITLGLLLFALGSVIGAISDSIYGILIARTLQGMGAVGSVLIALTADLTPDSHRTRSMAVIGMTIGISFAIAMVISPSIARFSGLSGIFWFSAGISLLGLVILWTVVPTPKKEVFHPDSSPNIALLAQVTRSSALMRLNSSIFLQHFLLTTTFYAVPIILQKPLADGSTLQTWYFYLPIMLVAFCTMIPFIILAESKKKMKGVLLGAITAILLSQLLLACYSTLFVCFTLLVVIYFTGFNILEACLPSLISKHAPLESKGTAMGVYSSFQFLGIFVGGVVAGLLYSHFQTSGIFYTNTFVCLIWIYIVRDFEPMAYTSTSIFKINDQCDRSLLQQALLQMKGVQSVFCAPNEPLVFLKVNKKHFDNSGAEELIQQAQ
jgi:MFS family permease